MNDFYARMIGKLLGDGCLIKQKNRQPRFLTISQVYLINFFCFYDLVFSKGLYGIVELHFITNSELVVRTHNRIGCLLSVTEMSLSEIY